MARVYPDEQFSALSPLVGFATLSRTARAKMTDYGLRLGEAYRGVVQAGISQGSIRELDVASRTTMLTGLTSWLVGEDVSTDPVRRQQIAREIANLVVAGFGVPLSE